jgi:hypothetical protein
MRATRMEPIFETLKESGPTTKDSVARISTLAKVLDSAIPIPGTNRTIGIDPLLGLFPVVGDAISAALASYIIWEARQLGIPRWKIARMIGNMALDTAVGAVPLVGDLFDMAYKSNRRNLRIVLDHLEQTGRLTPKVIEGTAVRVEESSSPRLRGEGSGRELAAGASPKGEGEGMSTVERKRRHPLTRSRLLGASRLSPQAGRGHLPLEMNCRNLSDFAAPNT